MIAARFSTTPEIVTLLLAAGAEIEARDNLGQTPLIIAAGFTTTPEIISLLLAKGADPLAKDNAGHPVLAHAQENEELPGTRAYQQLRKRSRKKWRFW
jgi:ankyrin repeat protein